MASASPSPWLLLSLASTSVADRLMDDCTGTTDVEMRINGHDVTHDDHDDGTDNHDVTNDDHGDVTDNHDVTNDDHHHATTHEDGTHNIPCKHTGFDNEKTEYTWFPDRMVYVKRFPRRWCDNVILWVLDSISVSGETCGQQQWDSLKQD